MVARKVEDNVPTGISSNTNLLADYLLHLNHDGLSKIQDGLVKAKIQPMLRRKV